MMGRIHSSWNSDRVAAAYCAQRSAKSFSRRPAALCATYRMDGNEVSVVTRRGRKVFTRQFDGRIVSACVHGDLLEVETSAGSFFRCDAHTGALKEVRRAVRENGIPSKTTTSEVESRAGVSCAA